MALEERVEYGTAHQFPDADGDFSTKVASDLVRIDLACGATKKEGYKGMDKFAVEGVDIVHDLLTFPWPLEDNSVFEFECSHFVEHIPIILPNGEYGLYAFMNEVYRCLMPGGAIHIRAPYFASMEAWQDPTHTRAITDRTFMYFDKKMIENSKLDHYSGMTCDFEQVTRTFVLQPEWEHRASEVRDQAIRLYNNVVQEIRFLLRKRVS